MKSRQFGVSTASILRGFDHAIFNENTTTCILAHEQDALNKLFEIVSFAYKHMDPKFKPEVGKGGGSKYELRFPEIDSKIYVDLSSRGDTIQYLHVSEAAFIDDPDSLRATMQTVPTDGIIVLETTPNGMNWFYDDWIDPGSVFKKLFYPWFFHDEYAISCDNIAITPDEDRFILDTSRLHGIKITPEQIAFRRIKQAELKDLFLQEYPENDISCFLTSGNPFFDQERLKARLISLPIPVEENESLTIYERPNSDYHYGIGADTAEGVGGDLSAAGVWCKETMRQVASLRGNFKPSEFAHALFELGSRYRNNNDGTCALLGVERNNHGHAVLLELGSEHMNYPNLYQHTDDRAGWLTNSATKPIMLNAMRDVIDSNPNCISDKITIQECLTFVNNEGKLGAIVGKHDDTVIGNAIGIQMAINISVSGYFGLGVIRR